MLDGSSKGRRPFAVSGELRERVLSQLKAALEARREVLLAVAFGSFVERSLARDVDVAVYLPAAWISWRRRRTPRGFRGS